MTRAATRAPSPIGVLRTTGWVRVLAGIGAAGVALAVVAMASGARTAPAPDTAAASGFDDRSLNLLMTAVALVLLLGAIAFFLSMVLHASKRDRGSDEDENEAADTFEVHPPRWLRVTIYLVVILAAVLFGWLTYRLVTALLTSPRSSPGTVDSATTTTTIASASSLPQAAVGATLGLLAVLLAVVGVASLVLSSRLRAADDAAIGEAPVDEQRALDDGDGDPFVASLDELARLEPRAAILAAFDAFERLLTVSGRARLWSETAAEHITRIGPSLPDGAQLAATALVRLLHEAKFSDHPLQEDDRADAIRAFTVARDALVRERAVAIAASGVEQE